MRLSFYYIYLHIHQYKNYSKFLTNLDITSDLPLHSFALTQFRRFILPLPPLYMFKVLFSHSLFVFPTTLRLTKKKRRKFYTRNNYVAAARLFNRKHKAFFSDVQYFLKCASTWNSLGAKDTWASLYFQLMGKGKFSFTTTYLFIDYIYSLQFYFRKIFSIHFSLSMFNTYELIPDSWRAIGVKFLTLTTPRKLRIYYFTELTDIFLSALVTKNLCFIVRWIKHHIEKRPIKLFSLMRKFIRKIFQGLFWGLKLSGNLLGFRLNFVGKLVKGGGKKKRIKFCRGQLSHNQKSLRIVYKSFYLRTISGIVGCFIELAY